MRPLSLRNRLVVGVVSLLALGLLIANLAGVMLFASRAVDPRSWLRAGSRY